MTKYTNQIYFCNLLLNCKGLLPDIPRNKKYAEDQLKRYYDGLLPTDQWHEETRKEICNYTFSTLGKKLMTIENW